MKKYWLSVDRLNTWAKLDFEKNFYMQMNKKKYIIYWSIKDIESLCSPDMISASWEVVNAYQTTIKLQNIVYEPINKMLNEKFGTNKNYLSYALNI